jgi:chorismate mutase
MHDVEAELARLRGEIDAIDEQVGALLAHRFARTDALGAFKALAGEAAIDPRRQLQRKQLLHEMAARHRLPLDLVVGLFDRIKEEVVRRHRAAGCGDRAPDA